MGTIRIPSSQAQVTVADAGLIKKEVVTVDSNATVMEALFIMQSEGISSVAIVPHGTNILSGSISLADVKYILSERMGLWNALSYLSLEANL
jgi:CBS domain-containing protein